MIEPFRRAMLNDFGGLDLTELIKVSRAVIARSGSDVPARCSAMARKRGNLIPKR